MLKTIRLTNFQKHASTELSLADGLNIIAGPSDAGKSAIFRAIYWLWANRPVGSEALKTWGAKGDMEVELEFSDGRVVRRKGKGRNEYEVNGNRLEFVRGEVPGEVRQFLNLSEVNLQPQHNPYFLLTDSPGVVSQKLSALIGLQKADVYLKRLNSISRDSRQKAEWLESEADRFSEELKRFDNLDVIRAEVESFKEVVEKVESDSKRVEKLDCLLVEFRSVRGKINVLNRYLDPLITQFEYLVEVVEKIQDAEREISLVENWLKEWEAVSTELDNTESLLKPLSFAVSEISTMVSTYYSGVQVVEKVQKLIQDFKDMDSRSQALAVDLEALEREWAEIVQEAGGVCWVCGRPLDGVSIVGGTVYEAIEEVEEGGNHQV